MKTLYFLILFLLSFLDIYTQPNCEAFKYYYKDTIKYEACKVAEKIEGLYQFSKEYQEILDEAIKIDPTFAYAYRKKSTAYLKSGDFIIWKILMDKAVKYNPQDNLQYRGLMRYKCFRDYSGALRDFRKLDSLGIPTNHLVIAKALCYDSIGEKEKAIKILEAGLKEEEDIIGPLGYLHLGVFYLEQKDYRKAIQTFKKQNEVDEIAECHYYLAKSYKALHMQSEYILNLEEAKKLYLNGWRMTDVYIDPIHKIYLEDIEKELKAATNSHHKKLN